MTRTEGVYTMWGFFWPASSFSLKDVLFNVLRRKGISFTNFGIHLSTPLCTWTTHLFASGNLMTE